MASKLRHLTGETDQRYLQRRAVASAARTRVPAGAGRVSERERTVGVAICNALLSGRDASESGGIGGSNETQVQHVACTWWFELLTLVGDHLHLRFILLGAIKRA